MYDKFRVTAVLEEDVHYRKKWLDTRAAVSTECTTVVSSDSWCSVEHDWWNAEVWPLFVCKIGTISCGLQFEEGAEVDVHNINDDNEEISFFILF